MSWTRDYPNGICLEIQGMSEESECRTPTKLWLSVCTSLCCGIHFEPTPVIQVSTPTANVHRWVQSLCPVCMLRGILRSFVVSTSGCFLAVVGCSCSWWCRRLGRPPFTPVVLISSLEGTLVCFSSYLIVVQCCVPLL
jgi:hypothetical protein